MRSSAHLPTPYATCHAYSSAPDELMLAISPTPAAVIAARREHAGDVGRSGADVDHVVPVRDRDLPERAARRELVRDDERVVHEHVEPTVLVERRDRTAPRPRRRRGGRSATAIAGAARARRSPRRWRRSCRGADGRPRSMRPPGDVDGGARGAELERAPLADAAAGAGDDRDRARERSRHASPSQSAHALRDVVVAPRSDRIVAEAARARRRATCR